ncbi:MAG TPA: Flp family type IVb pilin [Burkholderiales bacterium]|nr:Flp family type IVb pilin [Burkholderiales bacterium]
MKGLVLGIKRFLKDEEGATMVEYGLLAALISIVCIAVITVLGQNLEIAFREVCNAISGAVPGGIACP